MVDGGHFRLSVCMEHKIQACHRVCALCFKRRLNKARIHRRIVMAIDRSFDQTQSPRCVIDRMRGGGWFPEFESER